MSTRKHVHQESFPVDPERLFELLHTPSHIRHWWRAAHAIVLPEAGGFWVATWGDSEDDPDYVTAATIREFDPPGRMVLTDYRYRAKAGPLPFEADFVVEFVVTPHPDGASLKVTQDGFPASKEGDAFLSGCETGWRDTFGGIRAYLTDEVSGDSK
ncbi:MAG TPA: SRPBCC domain-containing protein [Rhodothermales bacterium]|nr:SRPBCC domain-containing protein [Rhodothermales bacterium]